MTEYEQFIDAVCYRIKTNDGITDDGRKWVMKHCPDRWDVLALPKQEIAHEHYAEITVNDGGFSYVFLNFTRSVSFNSVDGCAGIMFIMLYGHHYSQEAWEKIEEYIDILKTGSESLRMVYNGDQIKNATPQLEKYFKTLNTSEMGKQYRLRRAGVNTPTNSDALYEMVLCSAEKYHLFNSDTLKSHGRKDEDAFLIIDEFKLYPVVICLLESSTNLSDQVENILSFFDHIQDNEKAIMFRERRGSSMSKFVKTRDFARTVNENTKIVITSISRMTDVKKLSSNRLLSAVYLASYNTGITRMFTDVVKTVFDIRLEKFKK